MKTDELSISGGVITTEQVIFFEGFCDDGGVLFKDVFHIFPKDFLNGSLGFDSFDKNRRSESYSDSIYEIKPFSNSADELGGQMSGDIIGDGLRAKRPYMALMGNS